MALEERGYSLLAVSSASQFNQALPGLLPPSIEARFVPDVSSAKRLLAERAYDFVLVNSPLPGDPGIRFAIDTCEGGGTVVLLLVRAELHDEIYGKVSGHGVFTLPRPTSKQAVAQAFRWMVSARERLRKYEKRSVSMEEKMAEIRLVNRAKWLLIHQRQMDEPQAHRYIERQAMDRCVTKRQVAEDIIETYGNNNEH